MPSPEQKPPQREPTKDKYRQLLGTLYGKAHQEKKVSPPKEEKKDTSLFGKKPSLTREEIRNWSRNEETWRVTKMPSSERVGLEKKIFDPKKFGTLVDRKEVERVYKEIKDYPERSKLKYGIQSESERFKTLKWLEKMKGK